MDSHAGLETPRLRLRQWRQSDRAPFAAMNANAKVMEFFPSTLDRQASDALADRCEAYIAQRGCGFWALELKQTGQFIGFTGLHVPTADLPFAPCVEVGWRLAHEYWGQGFASEAARAALRFGFLELGLPAIVSFTALANLRSRAVMQRLGMQLALPHFDHPAVAAGSNLRAHCLYSLAREDWLARQSERES
ncbi:MAG: family acetyltransferase [Paucimonas sp.]|nr:family acetyltransferase [Paucimonas sp.]